MIKYKETVCAVVVTYNRKELLIECLNALCKQTRPIDAVYVIDNFSNDGTAELLLENGYINELPYENFDEPFEMATDFDNSVFMGFLDDGLPKPDMNTKKEIIKIYYIKMNKNTGGAGGFHEGVKRGYEKGYDWLWLMDDDVEPLQNGLENLMKYSYISGCIQPSRIYSNGDRAYWDGYIEEETGYAITNNDEFINFKEWNSVNIGCFEGMLLQSKLVEKVGLPDARFFMAADDTIYGYKLSKVTNNIYIKDVCLIKKIDKRKAKFSNLALYLEFRNRLGYVSRIISRRKWLYYIRSFLSVVKFMGKSLLTLDIKKSFIALKGYFDGINEIWGKEKEYL